jgi:hypothetical protein
MNELEPTVFPLKVLFRSICNLFTKDSFRSKWENRNLHNGRVFVMSLEEDVIEFQQDFYIESSEELVKKLLRLNFILVAHKLSNHYVNVFNGISSVYFNNKFDIAINLYDIGYGMAFLNALDIANRSVISEHNKGIVFEAAVKVLSE